MDTKDLCKLIDDIFKDYYEKERRIGKVKDTNCKLCNPVNVKWRENGFYGFQCFECTSGKTAFIVLDEHRGTITDEEKVIFKELIDKHFPDMEPKGLSESRKACVHWYEFLVRKTPS